VTSSITVLEAAVWEKCLYDKIVNENPTK